MAFKKAHLLAAGRLAAALGMISLRGHPRLAAWLTHDFLWLYPTLRRNCAWHGPITTRFNTDQRHVWLTIDDGPDPRDTPEILDLLSRHDATATFFVVGEKVERHRALTRKILQGGHTLGNHTFSHPSAYWWALPRPLVRREIIRCNEAVLTATGQQPQFFRSPVGMNNFAVHPACHRLGLRVIGWSADGCDGCPAAPTHVVSRISNSLRPGAIILLHESGSSKHRVLALARLLERLDQDGYQCELPSVDSFR